MFFESARQASLRARIDNVSLILIGMKHVVTPCKRYLCPPKNSFGKDYIQGFTLVLEKL